VVRYIQNNDTTAYKNLPALISMGGHPNGFYMANLIRKELSLEEVINTYANPIEFIKTYNKAAQKAKNEYVFSRQFMEYLDNISKTVANNI
jgi:hypothetical protein